MYNFEDKGERQLTLRPELTAPVMRMIAEEMRNDTKPLRLSYYGQCYRYEEFKKGRYREFFQYGVELIGASGPLAEAEVIALAISMLDACGLKDWQIRIGHVGILKGALIGVLRVVTTLETALTHHFHLNQRFSKKNLRLSHKESQS